MTATHPRFNFTLTHGEIFDVGIRHYGEFIVAPTYADELLNGGMIKVDGRPGRLIVVGRFTNAIQLRWVFTDAPAAAAVQPQLRAA